MTEPHTCYLIKFEKMLVCVEFLNGSKQHSTKISALFCRGHCNYNDDMVIKGADGMTFVKCHYHTTLHYAKNYNSLKSSARAKATFTRIAQSPTVVPRLRAVLHSVSIFPP